MAELEEEFDYRHEIEPDEHIRNENNTRSRYFFAMISFLFTLLFLSIYLNNYYDFISGWLLLVGVFVFGSLGVFFLWPKNVLNHTISTETDYVDSEVESISPEDEEDEDANKGHLSTFERLVREALATIPTEFQEQMDNVVVRVQYQPGEEVMQRVGMKEGYTLLGLYEGVPLTIYGQARVPNPEIITIYQSTIEAYCNGDPDRIREQVRHTVLHEVAHHFGIDHEEMPIWIR
jgi:predicted Zn-dependent protease with MMP-like domain